MSRITNSWLAIGAACVISISLSACGSTSNQALSATTSSTTELATTSTTSQASPTTTTAAPVTATTQVNSVASSRCDNSALTTASKKQLVNAFNTAWGVHTTALRQGAFFGHCGTTYWAVAYPADAPDTNSQGTPIQDGPWILSDHGDGSWAIVTDTGGSFQPIGVAGLGPAECMAGQSVPADLQKAWGYCEH